MLGSWCRSAQNDPDNADIFATDMTADTLGPGSDVQAAIRELRDEHAWAAATSRMRAAAGTDAATSAGTLA
jgi:hypothetical protein